jgi:chemotaxis protein methyltransferase CheR|uniref:protein-glutamate O-methyltransferase n=1 Tax=candidate division CPR3 bacterium TaxID=2268181 RepID=A0A7C5YW00_UNCC3
MDRATFIKFRNLIYEQSGINIEEKKETLLVSRICKRMRALGIELDDFKTYYKYLMEDKQGREIVELIDAVSTNVTHFFREPQHFDFLSIKVDEWLKQGKRKFRLWCAACSTGEEPYTVAMIMHERCSQYQSVDCKILATDICTKVLKKGEEAEYEEDKLDSVPLKYRQKYFKRIGKNGATKKVYGIIEPIKKMVTFARLNLATPPFPMSGPFDVIFIRNVMIYFDNAVRSALLNDAYRLMAKGGLLFVGHSESLAGLLNTELKRILPSVYTKE